MPFVKGVDVDFLFVTSVEFSASRLWVTSPIDKHSRLESDSRGVSLCTRNKQQ